MSIFVISLLIKTSKLMMSKNLSHIQKIIVSLIILNFLIEIFPLKSTGSILQHGMVPYYGFQFV